jgi:GNAT superfamily N-acetyltransferase
MVHNSGMELRLLKRDEIERIWTIDRREVHHHIYRMIDGNLTLIDMYFDIPGWRPGLAEEYNPRLYATFDSGGLFFGMFDGDALVGIGVMDATPRGPDGDWLQLSKLFISRDYRGTGIGTRLFNEVASAALERGAKYLYISSSPTENTVNFYMRRGAQLATTPDPELFAMEPDDIHLLCPIPLGDSSK